MKTGWLSVLLIIFIWACKPESGVYKQSPLDENLMPDNEVLIRHLVEQIEENPEKDDSYIKLAEIYRKQGDDEKALQLLEKGVRNVSGNVTLLISLARAHLDAGHKKDLSATLKLIHDIDPDNPEYLKLSAGYSLLMKDFNNALFFANRAILANQYDDEGYLLRGQAYLLNKDSLTAMESMEEAWQLKRSMKNFSEAFTLALALGQHQRAIRYLSEIKRAKPHENFCYFDGKYLNETGRLDSARSVLIRCHERNPDEVRIDLELTKNFLKDNKFDSARYFIDRYLDKKPGDVQAVLLKAHLLDRQARYTDALEMYQKAMGMDSTSVQAEKGVKIMKQKLARINAIRRKERVKKQVEEFKPIGTKPVL